MEFKDYLNEAKDGMHNNFGAIDKLLVKIQNEAVDNKHPKLKEIETFIDEFDKLVKKLGLKY